MTSSQSGPICCQQHMEFMRSIRQSPTIAKVQLDVGRLKALRYGVGLKLGEAAGNVAQRTVVNEPQIAAGGDDVASEVGRNGGVRCGQIADELTKNVAVLVERNLEEVVGGSIGVK